MGMAQTTRPNNINVISKNKYGKRKAQTENVESRIKEKKNVILNQQNF